MARSKTKSSEFFSNLSGANALKLFTKHSDLLLPVGLMLAIGTFFISIPVSIWPFLSSCSELRFIFRARCS
jgi:hypothetical protein